MDIKEKIYFKLTRIYPHFWKLYRVLLWGKSNFNSQDDWDSHYEIQNNLENRIPNVTKYVIELSEKHNKILEVSAGFGNYVLKLDKNKEIYATEFSDVALDYLKKQGIKCQKALLPSLPYPDDSFDLVVSISVFEHLKNRKMVMESFKECYRLTSNYFILVVPYNCMGPDDTLIHNFLFSKNEILNYTKNLFILESWQVIKDNITERSISLLKKT